MVEPVSYSAGKARVQRTLSETAGPVSGATTGTGSAANTQNATSPRGASDMLSISAAAKGLPAELKVGPPVATETVDRIRLAISENRYPVDLKAITESLFQSFLEISR